MGGEEEVIFTPKSPEWDFKWLMIRWFVGFCSKFKVTPKSPKGDFKWLMIRRLVEICSKIQSSKFPVIQSEAKDLRQ